MIILHVVLLGITGTAYARSEPIDVFDLSFDELKEISIPSSTMIPVEQRKEPGTVYSFNRQAISDSGARNLNELFEIHVPGVHFRTHISLMPHLSMRGIISDRDDKYLTIVDGLVVNDRFKAGSDTERDIPLLADIESVRVVLGPSSTLHGSGAIAGLIIIDTISARTSEKSQIKLRAGAIEEFYSLQFNHTHKIDANSGFLIHGGVNDYRGADQKDAPLFFSHTFTSDTHGDVQAGEPIPWEIINYNRGFRDRPKYKAQLHYYNGNLDARFRYISSGRSQDYNHLGIDIYDKGGIDHGYRQWHASVKHKYDLNKDFLLQSSATFFTHDTRMERMFIDPSRERRNGYRYNETRVIVKLLWQPERQGSEHELAALVDLSRGNWGRNTEGRDDVPELNDFSTSTHSIGLEHIWSPRENLNIISNFRIDKHTYTDYNKSFRIASNYRAGNDDLFKLSLDRSYRNQYELPMRREFLEGVEQEPENASSLTFSHLHNFGSRWKSQLSYFYYDHKFVGFDNATNSNRVLGAFKHHGLELEFKATFENGTFGFNHSYTKLLSASLIDDSISQSRSASPYGYGDDLAAMPNHMTKLFGTYKVNDQIRLNGSLRMLHKSQGDEDLVAYYTAQTRQISPADPGEYGFSEPSYFLNLGLSYKIQEGQEIRLDLWNALGWINDKYNKRGSVKRVATYRYEPASVGISFNLNF